MSLVTDRWSLVWINSRNVGTFDGQVQCTESGFRKSESTVCIHSWNHSRSTVTARVYAWQYDELLIQTREARNEIWDPRFPRLGSSHRMKWRSFTLYTPHARACMVADGGASSTFVGHVTNGRGRRRTYVRTFVATSVTPRAVYCLSPGTPCTWDDLHSSDDQSRSRQGPMAATEHYLRELRPIRIMQQGLKLLRLVNEPFRQMSTLLQRVHDWTKSIWSSGGHNTYISEPAGVVSCKEK
jgi:hypothetical protein